MTSSRCTQAIEARDGPSCVTSTEDFHHGHASRRRRLDRTPRPVLATSRCDSRSGFRPSKYLPDLRRADLARRVLFFFHNILGVRAGERIAVLCHNDSDVFEIQFACQRIGAIFLPVNWRLALPELEFYRQRRDAEGARLRDGVLRRSPRDVARRCGIEHLVSLNKRRGERLRDGTSPGRRMRSRRRRSTSPTPG